MCDMDSVETHPWDPNDPYGVRNIRPRRSPSAPKGGLPPLFPQNGEVESNRELKKFKPRPAKKIISTALHNERKFLSDLERSYTNKRFRSTAFVNFCNLLSVSTHHDLITSGEQLICVFDYIYKNKQFITLAQLNSLDPAIFENFGTCVTSTTASINWDLFPEAVPIQSTTTTVDTVPNPGDYTPQSGTSTPSPVNPFAECSDAIQLTFTNYVSQHQYLAWLATMPSHYLLLGSAFCLILFYRTCKDLFLTLRFMIGFLFGYRVVNHRYKYYPQSGSLDSAKTLSQYLTKIATVAAAFVSLATLVADSRKQDSYSPQSGLESDDGAKFLGKVKPKFGSPPDKPATAGAPGISSVLNGKTLFQQPRVAPPKQISKKDPNDGPLNGFGIGI